MKTSVCAALVPTRLWTKHYRGHHHPHGDASPSALTNLSAKISMKTAPWTHEPASLSLHLQACSLPDENAKSRLYPQAHKVTRQLEYSGSVVELTEALTSLPSGGQVMLGALAAERVAGRLRDIMLPSAQKRRRLDAVRHMLASGDPAAYVRSHYIRWLPAYTSDLRHIPNLS